MDVRTKLECFEITERQASKYNDKTRSYDPCKGKTFKFQIVNSAKSEENKFYSAVSGGTVLELSTINEEVFNKFTVGGEYYVDISPAT